MKNRLLVVLGNQLFPPACLRDLEVSSVFMAEDLGLCTYVRHHQQKVVLFLSAMRSHADALTDAGFDVHYQRLDDGRVDQDQAYEQRLVAYCQREGIDEVVYFEIEDRAFEKRFIQTLEQAGIELDERQSPMFVTSREELAKRLEGKKRPFMADFYKHQRRRLDLLMTGDKPEGGQWSFDGDNRKKLPKSHMPPEIDWPEHTKHTQDVIKLVRERFADHPGDAREFCWPTTRQQALSMLRVFLDKRLHLFGDYEDAISQRSATIYHSLLSPALNIGLITPREFLDRLMKAANEQDTPINNTEGLVRQVIGWREFIRGIDRHFGEHQENKNFFGHQRKLTGSWWHGETGIPPLDDAIKGAQKRGWNHHIERLMVIGNLMNLCEIEPGEAYRWFMQMYVDSSDWVMGPNVYGMALFSDGGVFATKPYICGANYLLKMSDYGKGEWCDVVDGLYWRFVDKQQGYLKGNPRLNMMLGSLNKMKPERRKTIFTAAETFLDQHTR
jgi:deoxyribodipyrimidine photolyase-related protein